MVLAEEVSGEGGELDREKDRESCKPKRMEKARSAGNVRLMASTAFGSSLSTAAASEEEDREKKKERDRDRSISRSEKSVNYLPRSPTLPPSSCMMSKLD